MAIKTSRIIALMMFYAVLLLVVAPYNALCMSDSEFKKLSTDSYVDFYNTGYKLGMSDAQKGESSHAQSLGEKTHDLCYKKITDLPLKQQHDLCSMIESAVYIGYQEGYRQKLIELVTAQGG